MVDGLASLLVVLGPVAAGLHPGRAALARVDPRAPGVAVFDLEAMGYAHR